MTSSSERDRPTHVVPRTGGFWIKRVTLVSLMLLAGMNVWTGGPLLALWIGGRMQGVVGGSPTGATTVTAMVSMIVALALIEIFLYSLLKRVGHAHDALVGKPPRRRQHAPWHRGSDESDLPAVPIAKDPLTTLEKIMIAMVVVCVIVVEIVFFFFTHISLGPGGP